jgi:hypothetical protein
LPEHTFSFHRNLFTAGFRTLALSLIVLWTASLAFGQIQTQPSPTPSVPPERRELLPARLGENWRSFTEVRAMSAEQFSVLPDGDVYAEYGLQKIETRGYTDGKTKYNVEVFVMNFTSGAYGLLSFNQSSLAPNRKEFHLGRYLVSISSEEPIAELNPVLVDSIKQNLSDAAVGELPTLPSHLPEQDKIAGSEKYLVGPTALARLESFSDLKDVVLFTGGAEAVTAIYRNGQNSNGKLELLLVEYHTPQLATDGYAKRLSYFEALPQNEKERRLLKRTGNYIIEARNIQDLASAQQIVNQIRYAPKVYWEGRKSSDIPLEFRPPDPAAVEEALQTANVLIRTFYWIGVMLTSALLLGVIAGASFFYWKRYRRRKMGIDDLFSDAGGAIRLNLDEYLLSSAEPPIKQIGSDNKEN